MADEARSSTPTRGGARAGRGEPQRHGGLRDGRARTGDPPAVHRRRPADTGLVAHSDRGSQHLATRHAERLAEAGIEPSVGSVGDSCDNALAETVIGLFKTEVIPQAGPLAQPRGHRASPRSNRSSARGSEWVDWFNHRRPLGPIGHVPPAEAEARHHEQPKVAAMAP